LDGRAFSASYKCINDRHFQRLLKNESGASAPEYALILVVVGLSIMFAAVDLSGAIGHALSGAAACISNGTSGTCR
jgi:pilus assembly protein Flp/PilA